VQSFSVRWPWSAGLPNTTAWAVVDYLAFCSVVEGMRRSWIELSQVERGSDRLWEEPIEEDQTAALRNVGQGEASSRGCLERDTPGVRNLVIPTD